MKNETWATILLVVILVLGTLYVRNKNEADRRARLDACLQGDPKSAAIFYSSKTEYDDKLAIAEACLGGGE